MQHQGEGKVGRMLLGVQFNGAASDAALLEASKVDFVLLGDDGPQSHAIGQDPLSNAAFLMTRTQRMGLVATVSLDWAPFNVARALASLDHLSRGRAGWRPAPAGQDCTIIEEHLDVVGKLFDSWDDDALVLDKAAAIFADRDKVRRIRHAGEHFTVDGPLNVPRPVQGRPVMMQTASIGALGADIVIRSQDQPAKRRGGDALVLDEIKVEPGSPRAADILADQLAAAFLSGANDGVLLKSDVPAAIRSIATDIVPRLQRAGLFQKDYGPGDFRSRLGLKRPANRLFIKPAHATSA